MKACDDTVRVYADTLDGLGAKDGFLTVPQLRDRFQLVSPPSHAVGPFREFTTLAVQVHEACRTALFVPTALPGATGQLVATLASPLASLGLARVRHAL
jgi:hypothetical protein